MLRLGVTLCLVAITACTVELDFSRAMQATCDTTADCPGNRVCVTGVGFCSVLDNPCIEREGELYVPVTQGNICALTSSDGICIDGRCTESLCGDRFVDVNLMGEGCDDGEANALLIPDGCRTDCQQARCGDGVHDPAHGETCDLGTGNGPNSTCSTNCTSSCGDGAPQLGEVCDDGNPDNGDGCDINCTESACGNGIKAPNETCDDGNATDGDGCDSNCRPTSCGNGVTTFGEACDDGNFVNGDDCDANCFPTGCGNAVPSPGEECDDGDIIDGDGCDSNCTVTRCGNDIETLGEGCDDGNLVAGDDCDPNCTPTGCGNDWLSVGEQCDDGDLTDDDGCDSNCKVSGCGNGITNLGEACDDGNLVNADSCDANCTVTACQNGIVTPGEQCDDGNANAGDTCDPNCAYPGCPNGYDGASEGCDDGNYIDGDGCDRNCTVSGCGNGIIAASENCDDTNSTAGDGCGATCTIEIGWSCRASPPPFCSPLCGDGLVVGNEQCDDQDTSAGDGCNACQVELGYGCHGQPSQCAHVWFVDASVSASGVGTSWGTAFKTLGPAITAAAASSETQREIWVANGTYRPGTLRTDTFFVPNGVGIYGGFAGNETTRERRSPSENPTILSGDLSSNDTGGFANRADNSCRVVTMASVTHPNTALDGFIIEGGEANGGVTCGANYGERGGGLEAFGLGVPVLRNLIFRNNRATQRGGAIYAGSESVLRIYDTTFTANHAPQGAAFYVDGMSPSSQITSALLLRTTFDANVATSSGGAIYANDAPVLVYSSIFTDNQAPAGGGIYWLAVQATTPRQAPTVLNSLFDNNSGEAIHVENYNGDLQPLGPGLIVAFSTFVNGGLRFASSGSTRVMYGSLLNSVFHQSGVTNTTFSLIHAARSCFNTTWSGGGSANIVAANPMLDSAFVPLAGSPLLDIGVGSMSGSVVDVCDTDADGVLAEGGLYDLTLDPCDLDGDGNIAEALPMDLYDNPRLRDIAAVGGSGTSAYDIGAAER